MSESHLFNEFPEVSSKQWKQKIQYDLKGADYNETLVWDSPEDIKVKPFYHAEDLVTSSGPSSKTKEWYIAQSIYAGDAGKANIKAKEVVGKGVESLVFTIPNEKINLIDLLQDIDIENIPLHFHFQHLDLGVIEKLLSHLKNSTAQIYLHLDPIGNLARTGNWYHSMKEDFLAIEKLVELTSFSKTILPIGIDVSLYQNAGANMTQQLAYGLAHAHEYLTNFQSIAFAPTFKVAVGGNYFFEIAKIKALRWLWNTLSSEYGMDGDCHIMAIPSKRNKTLYDFNVNMLRTTSESMSAILGGADTICNLSYDALYHKDNEFAERIAKNQLVLLKEESYFKEVSHAAEGAYYIESLTHQLAEKALDLFKQIEASGGFLEALTKGKIQQKLKESAAKEQVLFDENQTTLVGTNKFQNPDDRMNQDLELYPFMKKRAEKTQIIPIIEKRLAEELEQKRLDNE
ncbi:methylmalonyl-CoA mutase subunit beta [Flagellimonas meridianipacifica]|uniref:Methylmalonyl-CoA mutase n=1 Tax=Flagellimonas meridianipacifica TaxID=1080225 RepID=A0A2T0M9R8_9FLAO|nr:methylmalonyl-CoA mutase subunit beta [Allomuricauda pacifica]PRX54220.1 methylmalonyl-CoA mutase [Allomuricauda pacifica]